MKDSYLDGLVTFKEKVSESIYKIGVKTSLKGEPGQFFMLKAWDGTEPFLPRPISISDFKDGEITFLYEVKGRGTQLINRLKEGEAIKLLGPLGKGFEIKEGKKVALVAGGIGIAPLLYLAKKLSGRVDLYAGFRDEPYYTEEFSAYVGEINLATETGVKGHKGYVTEILKPENYDLVIGCGPMNMMKALADLCRGKVDLEISMESHMACGIGACMGCTVETTNGMKRVCKEGPVFSSREVIFK